jgi:hypothetical protein
VFEYRYDAEMERKVLVRMKPQDFKLLWNHRRLAGGNIADAWLKHPLRRTYDSVVFLPGKEAPAGCYNLWQGWAVEPAPGDWSLLRAHIHDNICAGNDQHFDWLMKCMAYAVQHPDEQGHVTIVMRGRKGTGKGVFANQFGRIFGQHFMAVSNPKHLVGNFNAHLRYTSVLFADEAFFAGDKQHEGVLKSLTTEDEIVIEAKFFDAMSVPNRLHIIMASNEAWVVPASADERRYFVLDVSDAHREDFSYFAAIEGQMDNGGRAAMLHDLQNMDLTGFQVRQPPRTSALAEQKIQSLDDVGTFWLDRLQRGELPRQTAEADDCGWSDGTLVRRKQLHNEYCQWATDHRAYQPKSDAEFGKRLAEMLKPENLGTSRPRDPSFGAREWCYVLPSLDRCRSAFDKFIGAPVPWENMDSESGPGGPKMDQAA